MTADTKIWFALAIWAIAAFALSWFCKKAWKVYWGSVILSIPVIAFSIYLEGPIEMGGIVHTLCAGIYPLGLFYLLRWIRSSRKNGLK